MISNYYNRNNDYSMNNKVKYLKPKIYRLRQHTQSPTNSSRTSTDNETQLNKNNTEYTLTPSKYRFRQFHSSLSNYNKNEFNQYPLVYTEDIDQYNNERFDRKSPLIMGEFILTEKPIEDHTMYDYDHEYRPISYIYKGTLTSSEVQERALNNMNQFVQPQRNHTLSSNSIENKKYNSYIPTKSNYIDDYRQSPIDNNEFPSIIIPSSNIVRSPINNNLNTYTYENFPQQNGSFSTFHQLPLSSSENFHKNILSNSTKYNSNNTSIKPDSIYYFGEGSDYSQTNNEENYSNEDEICVSFGRAVEPKPVYIPTNNEVNYSNENEICVSSDRNVESKPVYIPPLIEQSTPTIKQPISIYEQPTPTIKQPISIYEQSAPTIEQPIPIYEQPTTVLKSPISTIYVNYNNDNSDDPIFQEVIDVGTSTDNISQDQELLNTTKNNRNSFFQKTSMNNRESIFTNQSSRSETETYRVNQQTRNYENNNEFDPNQFSAIENPTQISSSNSSTIHSYTNLKKSTNYKMDTVSKDQSSEILYEEEEEEEAEGEEEEEAGEEEEKEEESHRSTFESSPGIQNLVATNPLDILQRTEYENLTDNSGYDSSLSQKSNENYQPRRKFFGLFRRGKKKSKSNKEKQNGNKKHKT